jgi:hypothetical protein
MKPGNRSQDSGANSSDIYRKMRMMVWLYKGLFFAEEAFNA